MFSLTDGSTVTISETREYKDGDDNINYVDRKVIVKDKEGNTVSESTFISTKDLDMKG